MRLLLLLLAIALSVLSINLGFVVGLLFGHEYIGGLVGCGISYWLYYEYFKWLFK
jgi:hypothetical protein